MYGHNDSEEKHFSVKDGLVLKVLPRLGINAVFLTGRKSCAVNRRAAELGAIAVQDVNNKPHVLRNLLAEYGVAPEQSAYVGDDLNDYAAMKLCGFKACPADAVAEIRALCDYVSPFPGGHGAVRDICEHILKQDGRYGEFLRLFDVNDPYQEAAEPTAPPP